MLSSAEPILGCRRDTSLNKLAKMQTKIRLYLWPHRLLFLGPGFDTEPHRHHAAQICVGLGGPIKLRTSDQATWQEAAEFFIRPDQLHQLDAGQSPTAILYLEAEGAEYRAYLDQAAIAPPQNIAAKNEFLNLLNRGGNCAEAERACRNLLGLPLMRAPVQAFDMRITAALEWLKSRISNSIRIADVAKAARLSESHLAHLFSEQIGVPLRRYILWLRLRAAVEGAAAGASLTDAAHAAGFSDSAHLSRSFKETFGVTPSFLFQQRELLDITIFEQRATPD